MRGISERDFVPRLALLVFYFTVALIFLWQVQHILSRT